MLVIFKRKHLRFHAITYLSLVATVIILLVGSIANAQPNHSYITRGDFLRTTQFVVTSNLTLYVDPTGDDSNACTGTGTAACLTIQGAINKVPKRIRGSLVTINVAAGTYTACAIVSGFTVEYPTVVSASTGAGLLIKGTMITATPTTGSATGTVTSVTNGTDPVFSTFTITGAGWTVNDFAGKLVEVTSGTGVGQYRLVQSNTADTVTLVGQWGTNIVAGSGVTIRDWGSIINSGVGCGRPATPFATGVATGAFGVVFAGNIGQVTSISTFGTFGLQHIKVGSGANGGVAAYNSGHIQLTQNSLTPANSTTGLFTQHSMVTVTETRVDATYGSSFPYVSQLSIFRSWFSARGSANSSMLVGTGSAGGTKFFFGADNYFSGSSNSLLAIGQLGGAQHTGSRFDCESSGARGIEVTITPSGSQGGSYFGGIAGDISNCAAAVSVEGSNVVVLGSGWSGTGNTVALSVTHGGRIELDAAATITGTTELSVDGATETIANMRAASPPVFPTSANAFGSYVYE